MTTRNNINNKDNLSLTEKYRPNRLEDCVLPSRIKSKLEKWKQKSPNHLIFCGKAGIGKTSTAVALAKEISKDNYHIINASKDNSVDYINGYLLKLMSCGSIFGERKIIILDEADQLTERAQTSLRRPLEEYNRVCSVIFTYNYSEKIIEPLKSRCFQFNFNSLKEDEKEMQTLCKKRLKEIIKNEKIQISEDELKQIIQENYPDIRKCVNQLELY
jgi:replication factor C small subunit